MNCLHLRCHHNSVLLGEMWLRSATDPSHQSLDG